MDFKEMYGEKCVVFLLGLKIQKLKINHATAVMVTQFLFKRDNGKLKNYFKHSFLLK